MSGGPDRNLMGKVLEMKKCYREAERILHVFLDWEIMNAWGRPGRGNTENQGELTPYCDFQCVSQRHTDLSVEGWRPGQVTSGPALIPLPRGSETLKNLEAMK